MVCGNHFPTKFARLLIKYHAFIFCLALTTAAICFGLLIYHRDQIHLESLLKGFQAHGTKSSDEYRKLIALIRETQTTHLFPYSYLTETLQQTPYPAFSSHVNPCSKRFYVSTCPILPYTELTFDFINKTTTSLFDDILTFKSACKLEWALRKQFTTCSVSNNSACCQFIGPVSLLFNEHFLTVEQCEKLTHNQIEQYRSQWLLCKSSLCSNYHLHYYLTYLPTSSQFKIYINNRISPNKTTDFTELYDSLYSQPYENKFHLININFDADNEQFIFLYLVKKQNLLFYCIIILYLLCLLLFVRNLFFILTTILHIFNTIALSYIIYVHVLRFPTTILNYSSITLWLFITFIDSFLWYTCWFVNNHRRDDCTINRILENLFTQVLYYLLPKNLTAVVALIITCTNQIITLQCFSVYSVLLISISFFNSLTLYPAAFVIILRHQSDIPTIEHALNRFLTAIAGRSFIDRTICFLVIRLKAFWIIILTILSCIAFFVIFQWPQLEFNACRITFDALPLQSSSHRHITSIKTLDIDITYYIGSNWEVPNEAIIPSNDIPILDYNSENKMTSESSTMKMFGNTLEKNLLSLIEFGSKVKPLQPTKIIKHQTQQRDQFHHDYTEHNDSREARHGTIHESSSKTFDKFEGTDILKVNRIHYLGESSPHAFNCTSTNSKFSSIITYHENESNSCSSLCSTELTANLFACMMCLNALYYRSHKYDDLFLIKNGLRFISDSQNPRYLLQTINYQWNISSSLNNLNEWKTLNKNLKTSAIGEFYAEKFSHFSFWWSSELFATYTIMEQLHHEKNILTGIKLMVILILLLLCTGILGIFVILTTICSCASCVAILTLLNFKLTVENMAYFTMVLIICSQYSVLYSISYKLAPTFFFQRQNRTLYSLKQLCTTLFHLTCSIIIICSPCLFSTLPYLSKSATIVMISCVISFIYSTLFLQSLLYYIGPAGHTNFLIPCHLKFICSSSAQSHTSTDLSLRNQSNNTRRHQRMSTSSHVASSYFSQMITGSTYFENEYSGVYDSLAIGSRRRESSRSYQLSHAIKRHSTLTGEVIELYTPRASLAPYSNNRRYSRHTSVSRGVQMAGPTRPLYVSPSTSPYSRISSYSQSPGRQRSPSSNSSAQPPSTATASSLRPCYSAPRLHVPMHRIQTNSILKHADTVIEETPMLAPYRLRKKSTVGIQRQYATSSADDNELTLPTRREQLPAVQRRSILKANTTIKPEGSVWLKRSNSS